MEVRHVYPVNVAPTDTSLKHPVPERKIRFVSRVVLLGTTYDMAVVNAAKDALGGMSKLAAVPRLKIQFVNYKNAFLAPTNTHHTVECRLASPANVVIMDISRNNYAPQRKILYVSAIVVMVTTYDGASVTAAEDALLGLSKKADVPKRKIQFAGLVEGRITTALVDYLVLYVLLLIL